MGRDTAVIGAAGEHLVLSRLLSRGILAAKAPDGTSTVDLVVHQTAHDGSLSIAVALQVKTRTRGGDGGWHMGQKHEDRAEPWLYYCFVDFEPESPVVYVIPSAKVAEVVRDSHAAWLAIPGKHGQAHNDSKMRRIMPKWSFRVPSAPEGWMERYQEAWQLLGLGLGGGDHSESSVTIGPDFPENILRAYGREAVLRLVPRHGESWTDEEELRLRAAFKQDRRIGVIAQDHLRTPTAIVLKLLGLGLTVRQDQREEAAEAQREIWAQLASETQDSA